MTIARNIGIAASLLFSLALFFILHRAATREGEASAWKTIAGSDHIQFDFRPNHHSRYGAAFDILNAAERLGFVAENKDYYFVVEKTNGNRNKSAEQNIFRIAKTDVMITRIQLNSGSSIPAVSSPRISRRKLK